MLSTGSRKSPYGSQEHDMDHFPLVKVDSEGGSKKSRRYRVAGDRDVTHAARERTKEHRKHRSGRERERRGDRPPHSSSPPAPNSSHKSRSLRRNLSAGRNSPHSYEGRRSHDHHHQAWERDSQQQQQQQHGGGGSPHSYEGGKRSHDQQQQQQQHTWEQRDPPHSYQLDRDDGFRQRGGEGGDRERRPRDQYEGRWGSGAPPHTRNPHRTHKSSEHAQQSKSRSPAPHNVWKDGEGGGGSLERGSKGEYRYMRKQRQARRGEESPLDSRHADSASEDSEVEEGEEISGSGRRRRVITLRHGDLEGLLRDNSGSSGDSSLESVSDEGVCSEEGEEVSEEGVCCEEGAL